MPRRGTVDLLLAWLPCGLACRFIMYLGAEEMEASEVLLSPPHNLLTMATESAREHTPGATLSRRWNATQFALRNVDANLDGWGVSWYVNGSNFPRRIRSAEAAVDGSAGHGELLALARGSDPMVAYMATNNSCVSDPATRRGPLKSRAMVGHVRAASAGGLDRLNSHPFVFNTLTWVHNGGIAEFETAVRDRLRAALDPSVLALVAGETDSEHAGAVFADKLRGFPHGAYTLDQLRTAMRTCLHYITELNADLSTSNSLNFGVTDGEALVVARYRSDPDEDPPTLYYKLLPQYDGILLASEPTDTDPAALADWTLLGKDRLLAFSPQAGLLVDCVDAESCDYDLPLLHLQASM